MMKRGDVIPGKHYCGACNETNSSWTYCGEQQLRHGWATLANCPRCHSTRVVEEVIDER